MTNRKKVQKEPENLEEISKASSILDACGGFQYYPTDETKIREKAEKITQKLNKALGIDNVTLVIARADNRPPFAVSWEIKGKDGKVFSLHPGVKLDPKRYTSLPWGGTRPQEHNKSKEAKE